MCRGCNIGIVLLFAILSFLASASAQRAGDSYDVRISLYRPSDEAEQIVDQPLLSFPTIAVPGRVTSVRDLLFAFHVYADSDAIGLIYALNPDLTDSRALRPDEKIRIVQIGLTPEMEKALADGFMLKIHYEEGLINTLLSSREAVRKLTASASTLSGERFAEASLMRTTLDCVSSVSDDFAQIANHLEDRDQATNHEMLSQVRGDIELLSETLGRTTAPTVLVTSVTSRRICSIAKDLQIKREGFQDTRSATSPILPWPVVRVVVNTKDASTGKPVSMLRIHYVPVALEGVEGQEQKFQTLSSPSERQIPEGDYVFWATMDQETKILGRVEISIRKTEDSKPLDIAVRR